MKNSNSLRLQMPICNKTLFCEISNDFTLPDYLPDIRKVISVRALPLPPAKYISAGSAELCAGVDYQLLYISSEGELSCAPFSSEYEFTLPLEGSSDFDMNEGVTVIADVVENGITTRVTSPRKLTVKCRLCAHARALGTMLIEESLAGETGEESIERLCGTVGAARTLSAMSEDITLTSKLTRSTDELRIIDAHAQIIPTATSGGEGYADVTGTALVTLLACAEGDATPLQLTQKIPFEARVESDEFDGSASYRAKGYCNDMSVNVEEGAIAIELAATLEAIAQKESGVSYTKDLYSTENYCEASYKSYSIPAPLRCFDTHFSQSERINIEEGSPFADAKIVYTLCNPTFERLEYERGKAYICGQTKYSFLMLTGGEYSSSELSLPFRFECDCECEPSACFATLGALSCSARVDGTSLAIDSELSLSLELSCEKNARMVSEARFGDALKKDCGDMIVCYPRDDESLWSVSKKYSVPVLRRTGLEPEATLEGVDYLVINL